LTTATGPGYVTFAPETSRTITLDGSFSGVGDVVIAGPGAVAMSASNTYTGNTIINEGTLAMTGSGTIASPNLILNSDATLDASGHSTTFTLDIGQTLTNSGSVALLRGDINSGSGTISLLYNPTTKAPAFTISGGTLALATNTVFKVNNSGATLEPGSYKLVRLSPAD
jgi:autotransporter-associated beta strand protein